MRDWAVDWAIVPEEKFTPEELGTTGENFLDPIAYLSKIAGKVAK